MPKLILDEFSNLPVSRQRKWQLRRERDGFCRICGVKRATVGVFCAYHADPDHRPRARKKTTTYAGI